MPATFKLPAVEKTNAMVDAIAEVVKAEALAELREAYRDALNASAATGPVEPYVAFARNIVAQMDEFEASGGYSFVTKYLSRYTRANREIDVTFTSVPIDMHFTELDGPIDSCVVNFDWGMGQRVALRAYPWETRLELQMRGAEAEEALGAKLEKVLDRFTLSMPEAPVQRFRVFIGHGGADGQWRVLQGNLRDHHDFSVTAFEGAPRAGQTINQVLESTASDSAVAVLVMSKADEMATGSFRARQNVVHEVGYFQGRLGWENAIVLVEEGVELFTNLDGTQHIPYPAGNIGAAVGELVASLNRIRLSGRYT